jgi:hypothetical protein
MKERCGPFFKFCGCERKKDREREREREREWQPAANGSKMKKREMENVRMKLLLPRQVKEEEWETISRVARYLS